MNYHLSILITIWGDNAQLELQYRRLSLFWGPHVGKRGFVNPELHPLLAVCFTSSLTTPDPVGGQSNQLTTTHPKVAPTQKWQPLADQNCGLDDQTCHAGWFAAYSNNMSP
jgi:hypothetical protein